MCAFCAPSASRMWLRDIPVSIPGPARHAVLPTFENPQLSVQRSYQYAGTLPRLISFVCHSYANTGGVGAFFPFWNEFATAAAKGSRPQLPSYQQPAPITPLEATFTSPLVNVADKGLITSLESTLTGTRGCNPCRCNTYKKHRGLQRTLFRSPRHQENVGQLPTALSRLAMTCHTGPFQNAETGASLQCSLGGKRMASSQKNPLSWQHCGSVCPGLAIRKRLSSCETRCFGSQNCLTRPSGIRPRVPLAGERQSVASIGSQTTSTCRFGSA